MLTIDWFCNRILWQHSFLILNCAAGSMCSSPIQKGGMTLNSSFSLLYSILFAFFGSSSFFLPWKQATTTTAYSSKWKENICFRLLSANVLLTISFYSNPSQSIFVTKSITWEVSHYPFIIYSNYTGQGG